MLGTLVEGFVVGSLYALIALGPCLVYGLMRVLDIANAATLTLGAYLTLTLFHATHSLILGAVVSMVAAGITGWALQRWVYMPILSQGPIVILITSIGVYTVCDELFRLGFGPLQQSIGADVPLPDIRIAGDVVTGVEQLIFLIGCGLLLSTWFVLTRTRFGILWRAVAQDREIASTVGINSRRVISSVFVIGYALAALSGVLLGLEYDAVSPTMGDIPAYKMLAIIILGGLGSPLGTIAAALLIGIVETFVVAQWGAVFPRDAIAFLALVVVLLLRPRGLIPSRVVRV